MWDLPRPALEPVFPALAGGCLTAAPPGKSLKHIFVTADGVHNLDIFLSSNFSTLLPIPVIVPFLYYRPPTGCKMVFHCGFDFAFP